MIKNVRSAKKKCFKINCKNFKTRKLHLKTMLDKFIMEGDKKKSKIK